LITVHRTKIFFCTGGSKIYRKGFLLIVLFITISVLNNCASLNIYGGHPIAADSINCDRGSVCADIRTGKYYINVNGTKREFILTLPEDYDNSKSYPLIFGWHGLGLSAFSVASSGYSGILKASENQAIFIAGQGLPTVHPTMGIQSGWDNRNDRDVAFVWTLINWAESNMNIDESRIFSAGGSYGAMFSNLLACRLGNKIRAIASMSGSFWQVGIENPYAQCDRKKVAAWFSHGINDPYVLYETGEFVRDYFIRVNECSSSYTKITPRGCVRYNDCATGYPVVWCKVFSGHRSLGYAGKEIWEFFSQF
jgi:poly(3-hydroxybutyrate) depolymerase